MNREAKRLELEAVRARAAQLEAELASSASTDVPHWPPRGFYTEYFVLAGFVLGGIAAMTSLLFNVIGSLLVQQHPLHLIQVYLTFPLGEQAMHLESGLALSVGCCLYLLTGMILGIPFHLILSRWFQDHSLVVRFVVVSLIALGLWGINFYGLIAWLQPLLFGGNWIIQEIPWWVAMLTHLVFGWTMLAVQPLGTFVAAR